MKKKNGLAKKIIVISVLALITVGVLTGTYIYVAMNSIYKPIDIIDRTGDSYTIPDPEDSIIPIGTDPEDSSTDTEPGETEPPIETQGPGTETGIYRRDPIDPDIMNILLLGKDAYGTQLGRTDTIIIMSYNKKTQAIKLVSLMRDMLIPIAGHDWDRINTAYAYGGISLCINTINDVFDMDIQHYVIINLDGLEQLVDAMGGVAIELSQAEVDYYRENFGLNLNPGFNTLDGRAALIHARNRTIGNADFTRTQRQRDILISLYNKILSENNLAKTISLINFAMDKVSTNLKATEIISLATDVLRAGQQPIETASLPAPGTFQDAWYKGMRILQIDIALNRKALRDTLYQ